MNDEKETIESAVLFTVSFFDIFDYPLTEMEIWQGLTVKCNFEMVHDILLLMCKSSSAKIERNGGWYFLKGRNGIIEKRHNNYILASEKFKIAKKAGHILSFIPGVRFVSICNNFSYKKSSDIDFFIITGKNRLFITRFIVTSVLHIFRLRRHGKKVANRICLSFYVSEDGMDLENLMLNDEKISSKESDFFRGCLPRLQYMRDPYFIYWIADILPIFDDRTFDDFLNKNIWLKKILPNLQKTICAQRIRTDVSCLRRFLAGIFDFKIFHYFGDLMEDIFKFFQLKRMKKNQKSVSRKNDTRVVISDTVLKFHEKDRRIEYRDQLLKRLY